MARRVNQRANETKESEAIFLWLGNVDSRSGGCHQSPAVGCIVWLPRCAKSSQAEGMRYARPSERAAETRRRLPKTRIGRRGSAHGSVPSRNSFRNSLRRFSVQRARRLYSHLRCDQSPAGRFSSVVRRSKVVMSSTFSSSKFSFRAKPWISDSARRLTSKSSSPRKRSFVS